jgi:serine/threonine protein kinase
MFLNVQSNYEEIRSVGKGSFGDVWLVRRKKDDRQFVLKKMHVRSLFCFSVPVFNQLFIFPRFVRSAKLRRSERRVS